jgi:hypothetical protein
VTLLLRRAAPPRDGPAGRPSAENPFRLRPALLFGAIFAATMLLVRGSQQLLGATGTMLAAGLSGFADVDAISIALARGARPDTLDQAALGIVIASACNNLFKSGVAVANGAGSLPPRRAPRPARHLRRRHRGRDRDRGAHLTRPGSSGPVPSWQRRRLRYHARDVAFPDF